MSKRQPEIKITYPDASDAAMLLTEAMIKRSSGRRVVETESTEREHTGQELFAGALACKTDTSVELTLRLNPDAMDYALATLIARNLTEEERQAIRRATDSMEVDALLGPTGTLESAAANLADSIEHVIKPDTNTQAEVAIAALLAYTLIRIHDKKYTLLIGYIQELLQLPIYEEGVVSVAAIRDLTKQAIEICNEGGSPDSPEDIMERLTRGTDPEEPEDDPSWEDVEKEAQSLGYNKACTASPPDDNPEGELALGEGQEGNDHG